MYFFTDWTGRERIVTVEEEPAHQERAASFWGAYSVRVSLGRGYRLCSALVEPRHHALPRSSRKLLDRMKGAAMTTEAKPGEPCPCGSGDPARMRTIFVNFEGDKGTVPMCYECYRAWEEWYRRESEPVAWEGYAPDEYPGFRSDADW